MNVYETVTARIIESLESGVIPWRKPWQDGQRGIVPSNYVTGKAYRGINVLVLWASQFASSQWLTYNQARGIGAQVRKGEKGTPIVFWKFDTKTDEATGEERELAFCRTYTVFNVEQCDGIPASLPTEPVAPFVADASAQAIADSYFARPGAPTLAHGGDRAFFRPLTDHVQMPCRETFATPAGYYATLYHEAAHSTGTAGRLARGVDTETAPFGSEVYSNEELCAEFTSAFLCAEAGISSPALLDNSAAYIANWLRALRHDKKLALSAAQRAQKAADYVLARSAAPAAE